MNDKIMIALIGRARSGKDTFYNEVKKKYPDFVRLAFADELKIRVAKLFNITVEELNKNKEAYRELLVFGGKLGRLIDEGVWVKLMLDNYKDLNTPFPDKTIITDCRFENEVDLLKDYCEYKNIQFVSVGIHCDKYTLLNRGYSESIYNDESEILIDKNKANIAITNYGSLEQFKSAIDGCLQFIEKYSVQKK